MCVRLLYLLHYYIPPSLPLLAPLAVLLACCPDSLSHDRTSCPRFELVRLGKSGCVQFSSVHRVPRSLLVTAVWVVPDGNLPARKLGLALPAKQSARRTSHPPPSATANLKSTRRFFSRKHAFLLQLFTANSSTPPPETGFVVIVTSSGSTVSCVTSRASD